MDPDIVETAASCACVGQRRQHFCREHLPLSTFVLAFLGGRTRRSVSWYSACASCATRSFLSSKECLLLNVVVLSLSRQASPGPISARPALPTPPHHAHRPSATVKWLNCRRLASAIL